MKSLLKFVVALHREESGPGLVEYVLLIALVAFAATAAIGGLANSINSAFTRVETMLAKYINSLVASALQWEGGPRAGWGRRLRGLPRLAGPLSAVGHHLTIPDTQRVLAGTSLLGEPGIEQTQRLLPEEFAYAHARNQCRELPYARRFNLRYDRCVKRHPRPAHPQLADLRKLGSRLVSPHLVQKLALGWGKAWPAS